MPHAEHTVTIERPAREVFAFLADGTNNPAWRTGIVEIRRTSPNTDAGSTYRQVMTGRGGRKIDGDYKVTDYDPPRRLAFHVTAGPARPVGVFELTQEGAATRVRFTLDLRPTGLMRLMAPMIAAQVRKEVHQLDNLKVVLERP